jgi:hypothetical protein
MSAVFKEYPKLMKHPAHADAVYRTLEGKGVGLFTPDTVMTSPERLPDVTVINKQQEMMYAAKGYKSTTTATANDFEGALLESEKGESYAFQEYPKYKYHAVEIPRIVNNREEDDALGDEWEDQPIMATEEDVAIAQARQLQASLTR